MFDGKRGIALHAMQGNGPHLTAWGNSHCFSRVVVGTWGTFSNYSWVNPSKLVFVQRCQDFCLVMRDTSGISTRLSRAIWMLFELRRETKCPFLVATVIL